MKSSVSANEGLYYSEEGLSEPWGAKVGKWEAKTVKIY